MPPDLAALRTTIAAGRPFRGTGYPAELRDQIAAATADLRAAGWSQAAIARAIGISRKTLRDFATRASQPSMRPVTLAPALQPSPTAGLTLVSPTGWRLEGLTLDDATRILAALPC